MVHPCIFFLETSNTAHTQVRPTCLILTTGHYEASYPVTSMDTNAPATLFENVRRLRVRPCRPAAFVEDEATKRAIAASLRDQRDHEERVRRQQSGGSQGAPRDMLGANGTPAVPQGATLGCVLDHCKYHALQETLCVATTVLLLLEEVQLQVGLECLLASHPQVPDRTALG